MDRTTGENNVTVGGKREFTDGPPGTTVEEVFLNAVQEEIVSAIEAAGLTPSSGDTTQLRQAILAFIGLSTAFRGALVAKSVNSDIVTATSTALAWDTETYDTGDFWSTTNRSRLLVPSGISRIVVKAGAAWENAGVDINARTIQIFKNGTSFVGMPAATIKGYGTPTANNIVSPVLNVDSTGVDYFEAIATHEAGANREILADGATWFAIEVID